MLYWLTTTRSPLFTVLLAVLLALMPGSLASRCHCSAARGLDADAGSSVEVDEQAGSRFSACCDESGRSKAWPLATCPCDCGGDCPCQCKNRSSEQQFEPLAHQDISLDDLAFEYLRVAPILVRRAINRRAVSPEQAVTALHRCIFLSRFQL